MAELTVAAKLTAEQVYGRVPARTYMTGISNGGYLTRWQLEHYAQLYDGGVDWEGTLFTPDVNLFTFLPPALDHYPGYFKTHNKADHDAIIAAGFAPGSESLWPQHYGIYWDLTQRVYREAFDPGYDGSTKAGTPLCGEFPVRPAGCDADYDYASRPAAVHKAVKSVSLTGKIGKPLLTLHGTLDTLLPIRVDSDIYNRMVSSAGQGARHRYYRIEAGNHVDSFADTNTAVRPILPCYYDALVALDGWITKGTAPPRSGTVARPTSGDEANECALPGTQNKKAVSGSTSPQTGQPGTSSGAGTSGASASASAGTAGTAGTASTASTASRGSGVGGSLASTGLAPGLPAAAVALLMGAYVLRRRRTA